MANDTRNPADVLRDNILQDLTGQKNPSVPNTASSAGQGSDSGQNLTFRDPETGKPKKFFKFGRHSWDDPDAIFY